jgi:ATP-binding cassette subfamily B protein
MRWAGDAMRLRQKQTQAALALATAEAHRALLNMRTLRLFAAEPAVMARYSTAVREVERQAVAVGSIGGLAEAGVGLALQGSLLAVLAVGGQQVIDGSLSYGDLSAFLMYTVFLGFNAGNLGGAYAEARRASGASTRLLEIIQARRYFWRLLEMAGGSTCFLPRTYC